jgi:predicted ArsR family transcriptional regulator
MIAGGAEAVDREQQITSVLADGTRYRIYRTIVGRPKAEFTVAEMAALFGLHPNVARMHLGKLEQAGLLTTSLRKGPGGGRPAKLYRLSDQVSSITLPPRRYELLADLALAALDETIERDRLVAICREVGLRRGREVLASRPTERVGDPQATAALLAELADQSGMVPVIEWNGDALVLDIRNCVFKELSTARPELVCAMHRAYFEGVVEAVSADHALPQIDGDCFISHGDDACHITVTFS